MADRRAAMLNLVAGDRVLRIQQPRVDQPFDRTAALSQTYECEEVVFRGPWPEVARQAPLRDLRDLCVSVHSHIIQQAARFCDPTGLCIPRSCAIPGGYGALMV